MKANEYSTADLFKKDDKYGSSIGPISLSPLCPQETQESY